LSNVARDMTVDQLREALLNPGAHIAPGYGLVSLQLRDGSTLRGFVRNRTRFDIAGQDLKGRFHPLSLDQVARITEEKSSLMPPLKASRRSRLIILRRRAESAERKSSKVV